MRTFGQLNIAISIYYVYNLDHVSNLESLAMKDSSTAMLFSGLAPPVPI